MYFIENNLTTFYAFLSYFKLLFLVLNCLETKKCLTSIMNLNACMWQFYQFKLITNIDKPLHCDTPHNTQTTLIMLPTGWPCRHMSAENSLHCIRAGSSIVTLHSSGAYLWRGSISELPELDFSKEHYGTTFHKFPARQNVMWPSANYVCLLNCHSVGISLQNLYCTLLLYALF